MKLESRLGDCLRSLFKVTGIPQATTERRSRHAGTKVTDLERRSGILFWDPKSQVLQAQLGIIKGTLTSPEGGGAFVRTGRSAQRLYSSSTNIGTRHMRNFSSEGIQVVSGYQNMMASSLAIVVLLAFSACDALSIGVARSPMPARAVPYRAVLAMQAAAPSCPWCHATSCA